MKKRIVIIVVFVLILMVVGFGWYICRQADASDSESRIGNIFAGGIVANLSDELYFMETVGNDTGLYRSDGSLESKKKISDEFCHYINIGDDKIYYADLNNLPHVMNKDGSGVSRLSDVKLCNMFLYDNRLYGMIDVENEAEPWKKYESGLVAMDLNGDNAEILCQRKIDQFFIHDEKIYYIYNEPKENANSYNQGYCRRMNTDGTNDELVFKTDSLIIAFSITDDWLYYVASPGRLVKRNIFDDNSEEVIKETGIFPNAFFVNFSEDYMIYQHDSLTGFSAVNLKTGKETLITKPNEYYLLDDESDMIYETSFYIIDNKTYFYDDGKLSCKALD